MTRLSRKQAGAYYTPDAVVANLVRWAVRKDSDRLLDPSCGDGRFIAAHRNSFGVEQDAEAVVPGLDSQQRVHADAERLLDAQRHLRGQRGVAVQQG